MDLPPGNTSGPPGYPPGSIPGPPGYPPGYPTELVETALLDDGTEVLFRPILPEDAARIERLFHRLSPQTVYRRFFTIVSQPDEKLIRYLVNVDHQDRLALVAVVDDEIVGVARCDRLAGGDEAEAAVTVEDAWQGRGIGTRLLWRLTAAARARGIVTFSAEVLADNQPMLGLLQVIADDLEIERDGTECHIRMHLDKMRPRGG